MSRWAVAGVLCALAGCATVPPAPPEPVVVTKYVQTPIPPSIVDNCRYVEPEPACERDKPVFCNGQLRDMLDAYRVALSVCRGGIEAVVEGQR